MTKITRFAPALALAAAAALSASPAQAQDSGSWVVRARALHLSSANSDSTGLNLSINDKTFPEVDFGYFFTPNIAAELILTYPQSQDLSAGGTKIGSFKHLPPTLTAQYHFTDLGRVRPYLGAGVNYTHLSNVELPAGVTVKKNSWGLALQAGVDVPIGNGWLVNVDLKKVQIATTVYAAGADIGKFKVDPLLFGIGIGKRF